MSRIKLGARWPDYAPETAIDRGAIRQFVAAVDEMGFDHITAFDHPMAMSSERVGHEWGWTTARTWHESLTLFSFMSALTERLGFMTAIYVLPLRSAVLVAKQVASLDAFTDGRFRLGISSGSNRIEADVLGTTFDHRGSRLEEQIAVLRALWTHETTSFQGQWHDFSDIGLGSSVTKSIPIWLGMSRNPPSWVLRWAGRLADGILPTWLPDDQARLNLDQMKKAARDVGRDESEIGIEPAINLRSGRAHNWVITPRKTDDELTNEIKAWSELGATHLEIKTRSCGLTHLDQHLEELARFKGLADSALT